MPKGTKLITTLSLESWSCDVCDLRKLFQTEKQRHHYDKLHTRFCNSVNVGSEVIDDYGNSKKTTVIKHKLPF